MPSGYRVAVPDGDPDRPKVFWTVHMYSLSLSLLTPPYSLSSFSFSKIRIVQHMFERPRLLTGVPCVWYPTGTQKFLHFIRESPRRITQLFFWSLERTIYNELVLSKFRILSSKRHLTLECTQNSNQSTAENLKFSWFWYRSPSILWQDAHSQVGNLLNCHIL